MPWKKRIRTPDHGGLAAPKPPHLLPSPKPTGVGPCFRCLLHAPRSRGHKENAVQLVLFSLLPLWARGLRFSPKTRLRSQLAQLRRVTIGDARPRAERSTKWAISLSNSLCVGRRSRSFDFPVMSRLSVTVRASAITLWSIS